MTKRVMRAPVGWFERNPLGRILNRFSSDIQEVDKGVMDALGSTLVCMFSAVSIVVVISYTVRERERERKREIGREIREGLFNFFVGLILRAWIDRS